MIDSLLHELASVATLGWLFDYSPKRPSVQTYVRPPLSLYILHKMHFLNFTFEVRFGVPLTGCLICSVQVLKPETA